MKNEVNSETLLWKKLLLGDRQSFSNVFDMYWEPLFHYAYKVLQNREDAEELVQEFFIYIWNRRGDLPELQSVQAYLFTALKNRLLNHLAKKKYRVTSLEGLTNHENYLSASDQLERKSTEKFILSLAESLPAKMQQAYMLHQFRGLSIAEIATETGNSEQTIRNQLNTAIRKLSALYRGRIPSPILILIFFSHFFQC